MGMFNFKVALADVRPSAQNPRRDFGDVAALAESLRATGGEPINPIVVVADGDAYRLVDGERRYRAMSRLGTETCHALVFDSYDDAEEAVAAMATDDKMRLSDEERARGFQRMLLLGVPDEVVSQATGVAADRVRRARRYASEAPEQTTLDAMILASEFDDADDRAAVMAAGDDAGWKAREIRRRISGEAKLRELEGMAPDGVTFFRKGDAGMPAVGSREWRYLMTFGSASDAPAVADRVSAAGGSAVAVAVDGGCSWALYVPAASADPEREAADRERERRDAEVDGCRSALRSCFVSMARHVIGGGRVSHLSAVALDERETSYAFDEVDDLVWEATPEGRRSEGRKDAAYVLALPPSTYELVETLVEASSLGFSCCLYGYDGSVSPQRAESFARAYDALVADGWDPDEHDAALRGLCATAIDGDGDGNGQG